MRATTCINIFKASNEIARRPRPLTGVCAQHHAVPHCGPLDRLHAHGEGRQERSISEDNTQSPPSERTSPRSQRRWLVPPHATQRAAASERSAQRGGGQWSRFHVCINTKLTQKKSQILCVLRLMCAIIDYRQARDYRVSPQHLTHLMGGEHKTV